MCTPPRMKVVGLMTNGLHLTLCCLIVTTLSVHAQGRNVDLLGHWSYTRGASDVWGYTDANGNEYALIGVNNGTAIINVTDPANPTQAALIPGPLAPPYHWRDIKTHLHYAYITSEGTGAGAGLQVVDLSDPPNAELVFTYDSTFTTAHNLYIAEGYAYVVGTSGAVFGFHVLDLSNPKHPVEVGTYHQKYIHDIYVRGNFAYASAIVDGTLEILDVSNKANLATLASIRSPAHAVHSAWTTEDGNYVMTTDETIGGHLLIWDIRDLSNIEAVAEYESGLDISIHNVHIKGNYAHISYYQDGYRLVDISNPDSPVEVGYYDTLPGGGRSVYDGAWGVYPYAPSGNIYVSDMATGLYVLRPGEDLRPGTIRGSVVDGRTGLPLAGTQLQFVEANKFLTAGPNGLFSLRILGGHHTIAASAFGYLPDTVEVDLEPGGEQNLVIQMPVNDAALAVSIDSVRAELPVGRFLRQEFTVSNAGGGIMAFRVRDIAGPLGGMPERKTFIEELPLNWSDFDYFEKIKALPKVAPANSRLPYLPPLETIIVDPVGDAPRPPDVIAIKAGKDSAQVTIQVVVDGILDPADFAGAISLDVDQDLQTGVLPVYGNASQIIGADFAVTTFNLSDSIVSLLELPNFNLVSDVPALLDSNSFTFSLPLAALNQDDGNMNITAAFGYTQGVTDYAPDAGHGTIGTDIFADVPWIRLTPTSGTLLGGESRKITLDIIATRLQPDTVYFGVILVQVTNLDLPFKAVPVRLNTTKPVSVEGQISEAPGAFALHPNYPNPFNPSTTIAYQLPKRAQVEMKIFDLKGQQTKVLVNAIREAGLHRVEWDGRNEEGNSVSSGIYLCRLHAPGFDATRKLLLVR